MVSHHSEAAKIPRSIYNFSDSDSEMSYKDRSSPNLLESGLKSFLGHPGHNYPLINGEWRHAAASARCFCCRFLREVPEAAPAGPWRLPRFYFSLKNRAYKCAFANTASADYFHFLNIGSHMFLSAVRMRTPPHYWRYCGQNRSNEMLISSTSRQIDLFK